ncbi:outer membrane receptor protein involved in Fe transport [Luteibacter sp. Sphag1AF]|uniref:TonB-dependent receptor n=1 Tax=Luteibacter sp. Sphag1AF TaxID=2587031 RepID=UPI001802C7CF|nr:TonB-dependent receptor [Luteibacter sp. Sphag1AF]MBB3227588.1 outer membrane receptor protein involved in Fe transport [Luteibacter sp. Sphag1AF]
MAMPLWKKTALGTAMLVALVDGVVAQSTSGSIYGQVKASEGDVVRVDNGSGIVRETSVDARGRYTVSQLPLGTYSVSVSHAGTVIQSRDNVALRVGSGVDVSFGDNEVQELGGVTVSGRVAPSIDVTSVDSRTVVTADQLARLPLARSSEAIALLAPGVVDNTGGYKSATGNSLVTFGGSAASENAYYINGFNTTDPLRGFGGLSLPYGAIEQQEVYTGGYSAQYGRSDGGVISVVGKRGTNQWHAGAQVLWEPNRARAQSIDTYYTNGLPPQPKAGALYAPNRADNNTSTTVSAYAGGPLIKDKLFLFAAAEVERQTGNTVSDVTKTQAPDTAYRYTNPRWYAKLDWNIDENNILEVTGASDKSKKNGTIYDYDYQDRQRGDYIAGASDEKYGGDVYTAKYTGYITENLTLTAQYGKMDTASYLSPPGYDPSATYIAGLVYQNPAVTGGSSRGSSQTVASLTDPGRGNATTNTRIDLSYVLGDHTLTAGIDNQTARARNQGSASSGPGYTWTYAQGQPDLPISTGLGVAAPGGYPGGENGYYVVRGVASSRATVRSDQRAQYIEDKWQVTDRWLVTVGLRNDQFTNYNAHSEAFIRQTKPQWAPRLGFSWDVYGDASFKVYGNAGRYYLGLPLNPALNAAGGYLSTSQYFTYTGIAGDGTPTGLTAIAPGVPVSSNNAFGVLPDPKTVAAKNMKAENQDEYILGFTKLAGDHWVYGAKVTYRKLRNAIDDFCDIDAIISKGQSLGYDVNKHQANSCYLFNPGQANTFNLIDTSGRYVAIPVSNKELGFDGLKRSYYALELLLEHPFDGRWYAKAGYTFSRSYGNTEGQLRSDLSQTATSTSEDWDNSAIMVNTNGPQNNDHTHQLKLFGYYQIAPEWLASANISAISGAPRHCLGYYGPHHEDPVGYAPYYHFCDGQPSPPGKQGRLPWIRQIDLGLTYRPAFASQKLAFSASIFNLLNEQRALQRSAVSESGPGISEAAYGVITQRQAPRYGRFSVSYDF